MLIVPMFAPSWQETSRYPMMGYQGIIHSISDKMYQMLKELYFMKSYYTMANTNDVYSL